MWGIILFLVARLVQWLLSPLFFIYAILTLGDLKKISAYFGTTALSIDQLGNTMGAPLFNSIFLKDNPKVLFGDPDQTISYVLGANYLDGKLTSFGNFVVKLLNKLDENHVQKAVESENKKTLEF
jgi:hypothetical protein